MSVAMSCGERPAVWTCSNCPYPAARSFRRRATADAGSSPASSGRTGPSTSALRRRTISSALAARQKTRPVAVSASAFAGSSSIRPPVAMTWCRLRATSAAVSRSSARKASSPCSAKMTSIGPCRTTIMSSVSTNVQPRSRATSRPTVVFPVPMNPVSTTLSSGEQVTGSRYDAEPAARTLRKHRPTMPRHRLIPLAVAAYLRR